VRLASFFPKDAPMKNGTVTEQTVQVSIPIVFKVDSEKREVEGIATQEIVDLGHPRLNVGADRRPDVCSLPVPPIAAQRCEQARAQN